MGGQAMDREIDARTQGSGCEYCEYSKCVCVCDRNEIVLDQSGVVGNKILLVFSGTYLPARKRCMSERFGGSFIEMDVRTFVISFSPLKPVAAISEVGTLRKFGISSVQCENRVFRRTSQACSAQPFSRPGMSVEGFPVFESRSSVKARQSCSVIDPSFWETSLMSFLSSGLM